MSRRLLALTSILVLTACIENAPSFDKLLHGESATDMTTAVSFPEPTTTDAPDDPATTSTSTAAGSTGSDLAGESESAGPQIYSFSVDPPKILEPGAVEFSLELSDDVSVVELWRGSTLLGTVTPAELPFTYDVTSQGTCQDSQTFTAIARDPEGLIDSKPAELLCELPEPGDEDYTSYLEGETSASGAAIARTPDGGIVAAGVLDARMVLWRLDPAGEPVDGWPKTLADWSSVAGLGNKESGATTVAVDPKGALLVGGYYKEGLAFHRYIAKLDDTGALVWEDPGLVHEEVMGLAVSTAGDVVATGSHRTTALDAEARYEARIWGYPNGYPSDARWDVVYEPPQYEPPDPLNERSERGRAVLAFPDGNFAVVGERGFRADDAKTYTRAFILRLSPDGQSLGQWTSDGAKFANEAALAGTHTKSGFALAGWCLHDNPAASQQTCVRTFDADGSPLKVYAEPWPRASTALGVAQDREECLVVAGYVTKPGQSDAWIFASLGAGIPLAWDQIFDQGGSDFAAGIVCDSWGKCTWIGTTNQNGKPALVVSQLYP